MKIQELNKKIHLSRHQQPLTFQIIVMDNKRTSYHHSSVILYISIWSTKCGDKQSLFVDFLIFHGHEIHDNSFIINNCVCTYLSGGFRYTCVWMYACIYVDFLCVYVYMYHVCINVRNTFQCAIISTMEYKYPLLFSKEIHFYVSEWVSEWVSMCIDWLILYIVENIQFIVQINYIIVLLFIKY